MVAVILESSNEDCPRFFGGLVTGNLCWDVRDKKHAGLAQLLLQVGQSNQSDLVIFPAKKMKENSFSEIGLITCDEKAEGGVVINKTPHLFRFLKENIFLSRSFSN